MERYKAVSWLITEIKNQTMLWAVAYSKLPTNVKIKLLKRYYSSACFYTLLNIAKRNDLLSILEWLKKQPPPTNIFCVIDIGEKTNHTEADETFREYKSRVYETFEEHQFGDCPF